MDELGMTAKDVANAMEKAGYKHKSKLLYRNVESWVAKSPYTPNVFAGVYLARALESTVETLVEGEEGTEYVRQIVANEGKAFEPPARIADIVAGISALSDTELLPIRAAVNALVEAKKGASKSA
jgi:hypothetical protein